MTRLRAMRSAYPAGFLAVVCGLALGAAHGAPEAHADAVAYLVNVTVRPGYGFMNAEAALDYGNGVCMRIREGHSYSDIMGQVKQDFANPDEYQSSYLISQAANELCPELIWQLRRSAGHYQPPAP